MELADLNTLVIVAREQSFSRAARLLNRTQPAISLAVRRLEQRAGTQLFTRETKRPALTEAGRVLVAYAQQMRGVQDEARRALSRLRDLRCGTVTVGVDDTWCGALLPALAAFRDAHPHVTVALQPLGARGALEALGRGELDLAVTDAGPSSGACESVVLTRDCFVLAVPPGHAAAGHALVRATDLRGETFLTIARREGDPETAGGGVGATLALPSLDTVKRAVACGLGVAVLPSMTIAAEVADGRLVAVTLRDEASRRRAIWLARWRHRAPSIAAEQFFRVAGRLDAAASPLISDARVRRGARVA